MRADEALTPRAALDRILADKREQRLKLARLPFEEKFKLVVEMCRMTDKALGRDRFIRPGTKEQVEEPLLVIDPVAGLEELARAADRTRGGPAAEWRSFKNGELHEDEDS